VPSASKKRGSADFLALVCPQVLPDLGLVLTHPAAAKSTAEAGLDLRRFEGASTHWMRHTFVRQALVDGVLIEVVSELAGHASIDTTSIYSTQELARKIKAVQGMRRRVAV